MKTKKTRKYFTILLAIAIILAVILLFWPQKSIAPVTSGDASLVSNTVTVTSQSAGEKVEAAVMMYHHIGPLPERADTIRKGLTVSSEELESQVKYLTENGYKVMSLVKFNELRSNSQTPKKLAILTFDDGYDDNFTYALPILKKYSATGTFFIISSKIGRKEYMNEDQIKELVLAGQEIGSHSVNHLELDKLKGQSLERELKQSKEDLEKIIGKTVISFCYPAGKYNDETIAKVKEVGYKYAVTTRSSTGEIDLNNLFEIPRYRISAGRNIEVLLK